MYENKFMYDNNFALRLLKNFAHRKVFPQGI